MRICGGQVQINGKPPACRAVCNQLHLLEAQSIQSRPVEMDIAERGVVPRPAGRLSVHDVAHGRRLGREERLFRGGLLRSSTSAEEHCPQERQQHAYWRRRNHIHTRFLVAEQGAFEQAYGRRPRQHYQHRREDEQHHRKREFDRGFGGHFLGRMLTVHPQRLGVNAQR